MSIPRAATACLILLLTLVPLASGRADDLLGLYFGASAARSRLEAAWTIPLLPIAMLQSPVTGRSNDTATGFKFLAGIRPLPFIGAEVAYDDFGHGQGNYVYSSLLGPDRISMRGESAFGVVYLPVPLVDVFAKAGIASVRSSVITNTAEPGPCGLCAVVGPATDLVRTNTAPAFGGGAQYAIGHLAVRAEYERFTAAGAHPALVSLGLIWKL